MNITSEHWERFFGLRQRVFDLIKKIDDGYHKSYEGAVDVRICFDNIYESEDVHSIRYFGIELHCYLLVNGRHITFEGDNFGQALDKFESWLIKTEKFENE